jgi:hypothetical protein
VPQGIAEVLPARHRMRLCDVPQKGHFLLVPSKDFCRPIG